MIVLGNQRERERQRVRERESFGFCETSDPVKKFRITTDVVETVYDLGKDPYRRERGRGLLRSTGTPVL